MDSITHSLAQQAGLLLLVLIVALLAVILVLTVIAAKQRKTFGRWKDLLTSPSGSNLETILEDHLRERMKVQSDILSMQQRITELEKKMLSSKRFVGMTRFDAYDDVAGNQSFSLAVYDDNGNGAVITSLVGRVDCRVYCKPLVSGRSDRELSQEEQRAMQEAIGSGPKALLKE